PWISKSGQITADIAPEVSSAGALNAENYPDISRRSITTTVRLHDGQTIVIGGLIKSEDRETVDQVPLLGRIPIIGWLFKSLIKNKIRSELLVYITPHILTDLDKVDMNAEMRRWELIRKGKLEIAPSVTDTLDSDMDTLQLK
ncbi:MAG: type II and III secretion system protein, partial [Fibrobacteres bacterium]|nr:type II and III secretion system protein [Fibrobacterota bacterium]